MSELSSQTTSPRRLHSFDILRGFFIFLALLEHYTYYNNVWFRYFFKNHEATSTSYSFYQNIQGRSLPMDDILYYLALYFVPWVSQIYLTLAAFNLGQRSKMEFRLVMGSKLKIFLLLFIFFTLENFLAAPNFGGALSLYPIQTWMLLLSALTLIYALTGTIGVIVWMFIGLGVQAMPTELMDMIEAILQVLWHPDFEIDARPHYFWVSSCLGLLSARLYYTQKLNTLPKLFIMLATGALLCLPYWLGDQGFSVDRYDVFKTEHDLSFFAAGNLFLWGAQIILLSLALMTEHLKLSRPLPILTYLGIASLPIFALHRIFYIHIYGPIREFLGAKFMYIPEVTFLGQAFAIVLLVALVWWVGRTRLSKLIMERA